MESEPDCNEIFFINETSEKKAEYDWDYVEPPELGFLKVSFEKLRQKSHGDNESKTPILCALLIDEAKLTQKKETFKGKEWGHVEGIGNESTLEQMASKAVIFMVVSLTEDWKMPIGLFFTHNPDIKWVADTIEEALHQLNKINVDIISVTLNCTSPHLSFALAEELGADIDFATTEIMSAKFNHPVHNRSVHIFYDLDVISGSLKNYWEANNDFMKEQEKISYDYIDNVRKTTDFNINLYGLDACCDWIIIQKRLTYDREVIGKTTADAMHYLKDLGHPMFADAGATIQFLRVLDLINQVSYASGLNNQLLQPMSQENIDQWKPLICNLLSYIRKLKTVADEGTPERLSVFKVYITGLLISFTSLLQIYKECVTNEKQEENCLKVFSPFNVGLRHIRWCLYQNSRSRELTALHVFKKIMVFTEKLYPIVYPNN